MADNTFDTPDDSKGLLLKFTAEKAAELTKMNQSKFLEAIKKMEESKLLDILQIIKTAASNGKDSVCVYEHLSDITKGRLMGMGYFVLPPIRLVAPTSISWGEGFSLLRKLFNPSPNKHTTT